MRSRCRRAILCLAVLLAGLCPLRTVRAETESAQAQAQAPGVETGGLVLLGAPARSSLIVDGQPRAVTPLSGPLPLPAGPHVVLVKRAGFRPLERSVDIVPGRVVAIEVEMPRIAGVLVVTASTESARVYLDGTPRGDAPLELEVGPGLHQVRVHRDGYYEDAFQFESVVGEETVHDSQLRELPPNVNPYRKIEEKKPWYARWWVWTLAAVGAAGVATAVIVPAVLASRSDCQRLDAEVCFPVVFAPAATQTQAQSLTRGIGLAIRF